MKQIVQSMRTGEVRIEEVPAPSLKPGSVLVQNACSLISAGTERMVRTLGRMSLLEKARARPDLVRAVVNRLRQDGLRSTLELIRARLNTEIPMGYSCAGTVEVVGPGVGEFAVGDRVACGGGGHATHSEVVCVPRNLCVKVPEGVDLAEAAFTTVGAIALQGIRVAGPTLGEIFAVIGLGLVGQLTVQLLKANGCQVLGIDLEAWKADLAKDLGADWTAVPGRDRISALVSAVSEGRGLDGAIITAATESSEPMETAGQILRDKGRVVVVGAVGMAIPRKPYYEKELEVRLSRSYGPGRYDPSYEEEGRDYPFGYVRWTEHRNMEEFLRLVARRAVNLKPIITHRFPVDRAQEAYALIESPSERYLGILLEYPGSEGRRAAQPQVVAIGEPRRSAAADGKDVVRLGVIGAGGFAKGVLLPILKRSSGVRLAGVATATGIGARRVAQQFGFGYCTTSPEEILADAGVDAVLIATRHDLHASLAASALRAGKAVFVEKPLALSETELQEVVAAWQETGGRIMVGFNRRFAPSALAMKSALARQRGPIMIHYRVNAGAIPQDHWVFHPTQGGGRIVGEVCHFVDFFHFLIGKSAQEVRAEMAGNGGVELRFVDNVQITLKFDDGSLGSILYTGKGDPGLPKERVEVFGDGIAAVLDDFSQLTIYQEGKGRTVVRGRMDKGHRAEVAAFIAAVGRGEQVPVDFRESIQATHVTFCVLESLAKRVPVEVRFQPWQE